jgi:hypothetical protein
MIIIADVMSLAAIFDAVDRIRGSVELAAYKDLLPVLSSSVHPFERRRAWLGQVTSAPRDDDRVGAERHPCSVFVNTFSGLD